MRDLSLKEILSFQPNDAESFSKAMWTTVVHIVDRIRVSSQNGIPFTRRLKFATLTVRSCINRSEYEAVYFCYFSVDCF